MSIVVLASCTLDVNLYVDRLPERQGDSFVRHKEIKTGGCGYHVARAISDCTLCFPLGTGLYSDLVQKDLFNADFDLYLPRTEEESGVCYCLIEPDGERTFLGNHGAEYHYRKEWLEDLDEFDWAYVSGIDMEEKGNTCILDFIKERNMKFLFASFGYHFKYETGTSYEYQRSKRLDRKRKRRGHERIICDYRDAGHCDRFQ